MIEPNGPLPAGVYWRRRAFAAAASVLAVAVLAWVVGGFVGTADDHPVQGTASSRGLPAQDAPSSSPPPGSRLGDPSASASATSATSMSPSPTAAPAASPSSAPPGRPSTRPAPSPTVPPGPPKACPDTVIRVSAQADRPRYRVGERPVLRLLVVNTGQVPCVRDVNRKLRELLIFTADGRKRLWSSNDCYGPPGAEKRLLAPGKPVVFQLRWAGRTSAPGCPVERTTVPAGSYRVLGKLGRLGGPPTPLVLTP
jgi:hypothetical protein